MPQPANDSYFSRVPLADRVLLAHAIIDNAIAEAQATPVTSEQLEEIRRCDAAVDSGEMKCESWNVVRKRLFLDLMIYRVFVTEQAESELGSTARWYDSRCQGLGKAMLAKFELTVMQIQQFPESFERIDERYRRAFLGRFPS